MQQQLLYSANVAPQTMPLLLLCAASLLLPVAICRAQMDFFYGTDGRQQQQQQQQQQRQYQQHEVGAGTGPAGVEQQRQQQQQQPANLNPYDPVLTLYGQKQRGRSNNNNSNNGTWSAIGTGAFGTALPSSSLSSSESNATTFLSRMMATEGGAAVGHGEGNVQVQVHLRSYANPAFRLPDARLCTCPAGNERCLHASPQRNGYNCLTSLAVFVLSADDTIHFEETPYFPLNAAGQLGQQQEFGTPFRFQLHSEPSAIAVVVHNLGPQINMDGTLYETNTVTVVDTFVQSLLISGPSAVPFAFANRGATGGKVPMPPFLPQFAANSAPMFPGAGASNGQLHTVQLQGRLVGTQLSLAFSIACRGSLVGPGCDLVCNNSAANPASAICQSRRTGFFSLCRWVNGGGGGGGGQVTDCKNCPWGIKENAYCADGQGGVLEPNHAGVVSSSYYTAFVVLCCVCALLLLCMLTACLITCKKIVRVRRDSPTAFRHHQLQQQQQAATGARGANGGTTSVSAPLITARGDPERVLLTSGGGGTRRPGGAGGAESDSDNGGFTFRLGAEKGAGAKAPPPPYSIRSNGNNAPGTDHHRHQQRSGTATASPPDVLSRTSPYPLPRSNASTASAGGRETPPSVATEVAAASGRERQQQQQQQQQRFPPPLAIGGTKMPTIPMPSKTLSPPRFQPLPHLGPQLRAAGSGVDSLNSSFAGLPPPSVSADV